MNLQKLLDKKCSTRFNMSFFIQNIKKSKAILILMSVAMIVMNVLCIICLNSTSKNPRVFTMEEIGVINQIFLFIYPIALAIILFGFLFKKKSVDFVGSLPISRKNIYITNVFGGIAIIIILMLLNTIITNIVIACSDNGITFAAYIVDQFVAWTIYYILFFCIACLAAVLAGNVTTMLVICMLFFFLIPSIFFVGTIHSLDNQDAYAYSMNDVLFESANDDECISPINMFTWSSEYIVFGIKEIVYSIVFSVIYGVIGFFVLLKRRMEVCETSFSNIHIHCIVKSLTIFPFVCALYYLFEIKMIGIILTVMLIIYYFVYDLITRKAMVKIRWSVLYFTVTAIILIGGSFICDAIMQSICKNTIVITEDEVDSIALYSNDLHNYIYIDNKEYIGYIVDFINLDNEKASASKMETCVKIKLEDGTIFDGKEVFIDKDTYNGLFDIINKNNLSDTIKENITKDVKVITTDKNKKGYFDCDKFVKEFLSEDSGDISLFNDEFETTSSYVSNFGAYADEFTEVYDDLLGRSIYTRKSDGKVCYYNEEQDEFFYYNDNNEAEIVIFDVDYSINGENSELYTDDSFKNHSITIYRYNNHRLITEKIAVDTNTYTASVYADICNKMIIREAMGIINSDMYTAMSPTFSLNSDENKLIEMLFNTYHKELSTYLVEHAEDEIDFSKPYIEIVYTFWNESDNLWGTSHKSCEFITTDATVFVDYMENLMTETDNNYYKDELHGKDEYKVVFERIRQGVMLEDKGGN